MPQLITTLKDSISESNEMAEALIKSIYVSYIVKYKECHVITNKANRFDFYRAIEQFFLKYHGGRAAELKEEKN